MFELMLGLVFLIFMLAPFSFGSLIADSELPSLGLGLLIIGYLAYFHGFYLPIPSIINRGVIASFAIVDSIFLIFFGLDMMAFGGQNLLVFLFSLSVTYSIVRVAIGSIPTLNVRAKDFISLAILFVIARTTAIGGVNIIYAVGVSLMTILFPECSALVLSPLYTSGFVVVGMLLIIFSVVGLSDELRWIMMFFGIFWAFLPSFSGFLFGLDVMGFQFCMYFWVLQMAMVLFLLNSVFQAMAMDWMGGLVEQSRGS